MKHWQRVIKTWVISTFGPQHFHSTTERAARFLEEAVELAQACGLRRELAQEVFNKVYDSEPGEISQEIGGTIVTLLVLSENQGQNLLDCLIRESNRIHQPEVIKKCQDKQAAKKARGLGI